MKTDAIEALYQIKAILNGIDIYEPQTTFDAVFEIQKVIRGFDLDSNHRSDLASARSPIAELRSKVSRLPDIRTSFQDRDQLLIGILFDIVAHLEALTPRPVSRPPATPPRKLQP